MTAGHAPAGRLHPTILHDGFRLFFLAAGLWSALAMAGWAAVLATGRSLPTWFDPLTWHIHEMLFGFVAATVAGFLLTAIPNWTGRPPVRGGPLAVLGGLWLLGRVACLAPALVPHWLVIAADMAFPVALLAVAVREIAAGRKWRQAVVIGPLTVLAFANLLMHLEAAAAIDAEGSGWRLALAAVLVLIAVIGGRIVPAFTRNWLVLRQAARLPAGAGRIDAVALGILAAALVGWAAFPAFQPIGWLLVLAAALHLVRLLRWRGHLARAEPLLLVLHVGYGWLVLGTGLLGLAVVGADMARSAAIHALTAGAVGTMTLAVMTRATLGHTGRALTADRATASVFVLVNLAALARVASAFSADWAMSLLMASAASWVGAFGVFLLSYGPILVLPVERRPNAV